MSTKEVVFMPNVRLSFPDIWRPGKPAKDKPNEPGKYGAQFIIVPESEAHKRVKEAMLRTAQGEFGVNWQNVMRAMDKKNKALRDGNDHLDKSGAIRDGYEGMKYLTARNVNKPAIVDRFLVNGQPRILTEADGKPYGGCFVNAKVEIIAMKAFENVPNQVYAKLLSIQWYDEGTAFSGAPPTADGFDFEDGGEGGGEGGGQVEADDNLFD